MGSSLRNLPVVTRLLQAAGEDLWVPAAQFKFVHQLVISLALCPAGPRSLEDLGLFQMLWRADRLVMTSC